MKVLHEIICLFKTPEYLALLISIITIIVTVTIANKNRKHQFATEEYFKLQQIAEHVISKLLIIDNHIEKFKIFFELAHEATKTGSPFLDMNDTFNKEKFESDAEFTGAYIEIYFPDLREKYSTCLIYMGYIQTFLFKLQQSEDIDWREAAEEFDSYAQKIGESPQLLSNSIQEELKKYRDDNL